MTAALIRRLEMFCSVIEAGGATEAAARLGISQSAVSQSILKLENELGLTLFAREHGRMRPTETAFTLYEESSRAFDGLDRVFNLARDLRGFQRGQLRLAVPYSVASSYLPKALRQIARQQPKLRFAIKLGNYQRIIGLVAAREVDLGIAKLPIMVPGVESVPICSSKLVAVMAADAPLAGRERLSLSDLANQSLVMVGQGRAWRDEIEVAFRRLSIAPKVAIETHSIESACSFAVEGFGVAIVPEWLAAPISLPGLHRCPCNIGIEHHFVVVYPERVRVRHLATEFAEALKDIRI